MAKPDTAPDWPARLLLIGCGNMAGAMLMRWLDCGLPPHRVQVVRPSGRPVAPGVEVSTSLDAPVPPGTLVLLGCKPQQLGDVAAALDGRIGAEATLLSILAGVPLTQLARSFPQAGAIVRCMPNLPVRLGHGVCTLSGAAELSALVRASVGSLCAALGLVEWLEDEALFDSATALAGCGPAYVYRFIDALAAAGSALGLPRDQAARMAMATVEGAARNAVAADGRTPAELADAVASKGGMTREGLDVLDEQEALKALLTETLRAARDRGAELARLSARIG